MNERILNRRLALIFSVAAMVVFLVSMGLFVYASISTKSQTKQILAAQCIKDFSAFGIKANIRPNDHAILSYQPSLDMLQDRVNASSIAIGRCSGYRLVEFCAGNGCAKPGILFVLESV
ncbi:hypothetical protein [Acidovorax sp. sic0104]|uniref:hypothetical protein n=1 Tax=Acidovorax sp. sic0104 TaxID=2854784 RepID=UPI001C4678A1|nr:hypothetical protein [Acidovorax sp. sic0104]MBV7542135.1 hypothetical protein [Acidovorax sp. sic0104]